MYRFLTAVLAVALALVLVAAGFVGGYLVAKVHFEPLSLLGAAAGSAGIDAARSEAGGSESLVDEVEAILQRNYVEPPSEKKLEQGAIDGMIKSLGDPYTSYFDKQHYRFFKEQTSGEFFGVGIQIGIRKKNLTVIAPIEGTPAQKAGIKSGDVIVSIDGTSTKGMAVDIAASKIRGEEGTTVRLVIRRAGVKDTKEYVLKRVKLSLPNVSGKMLPATTYGYIRIHGFTQNVVGDVKKQMAALKTKGATAYVLDLRDNPGGLLQSGVDMASLFIDSGKLIIIKQRGGKVETLMASGGADVTDPVVILVNKGSASASEIFAGAMQDRHRAKLVGEQTFGKAAVQTIIGLPGGGGVKVTTAYYLTPGGHNISKKGIKPDYVVKFVAPKSKDGIDSQVQKAIDVLNGG